MADDINAIDSHINVRINGAMRTCESKKKDISDKHVDLMQHWKVPINTASQ